MERCSFDPSLGIDERVTEPPPGEATRDGTMGRYERRIFLDRLVELRDAYRTTEHVATELTADAAFAYTAELFDDTERLEALLAEEPADTTSDTTA
jgi:hypothetical protein